MPLSKQDGISTSCSKLCPNGGFWVSARLEAFRYCQIPLRFCHWDRCICGRGYSGQGSVPTLSVHGVVRGGSFRAYFAARGWIAWCLLPSPLGTAKLVVASRENTMLRSSCMIQPVLSYARLRLFDDKSQITVTDGWRMDLFMLLTEHIPAFINYESRTRMQNGTPTKSPSHCTIPANPMSKNRRTG